MKVPLFNQNGEKIEEIDLPEEIFGVKANPDLIYQVVVSQMARKRFPIAHTKTRAEVRGGGRKPWPQKGLGRARHGSIRSPIFKGGGVVFGPTKEKNFKKKIPKKMKRKALFGVLSQKLKENSIIFLDNLKIETGKTKEMAKIIENLKKIKEDVGKKSVLIVLPEKNEKIILSARNLPKVEVSMASDLNCLQLLSFHYLIFLRKALDKIKEIFLKK
jgi:large subunit ribosomal protein L4